MSTKTKPSPRDETVAKLAADITAESLPRWKRLTSTTNGIFRGLLAMTAIAPFLGIWLDWRWWLTAAVLLPMTGLFAYVGTAWTEAYKLAEKRLADPEES